MDLSRRFGGTSRLYGHDFAQRLNQSHFCVIGIGGVGSWAVESLVRHGVGELTLIDMDHIAESNINRQIHAVNETLGASKIEVMKSRALSINPNVKVSCIDDFLTIDNLSSLILPSYDFVIDAIDQVQVKIALIEFCLNNKIRFVTTGGAGGRVDPQKVMISDLKNTHGDKLIAKVRQHFNKKKAKKKIPVVFSPEVLRKPEACDSSQLHGLGCEGYGSSMNVTATFGFFAAAYAMNHL